MKELALNGGTPIRTKPWPLMYPGGTVYDDREVEAAIQVIRAKSPFRHYGVDLQNKTDELEMAFSKYLGNRYSLAVASGSTALTTILASLGVGPGDEVILPTLLWISDANSVMWLRAMPVFCDIDETWNLDAEQLEKLITPRTKAIIAIHMAGSAADMPAIMKVANSHQIPVVEDCCQASGGSIGTKKLGSFGDIAAFSLQYNKNLTSGEGGLISTNDEKLYRACKCFSDVGFERDVDGVSKPLNSPFESYGIGCRMDEIRGAIGLEQLKKLDNICSLMRTRQISIKEKLSSIEGLSFRKQIDPQGDSGAALGWLMDTSNLAEKFRKAIQAEGIPVTTAPGGIHQFRNISTLFDKVPVTSANCPWSCPFNEECSQELRPDMFPKSDDILDRSCMLYLPPIMTDEDEDDAVTAIKKVSEKLL